MFLDNNELTGIVRLILCSVVFLGLLTGQARAEDQADSAEVTKKVAEKKAPPVLDGTWFGPRRAPKARKTPLAVILASKNFPAGSNDYWVNTLWKMNFSTLVLKCSDDRWKDLGVSQIKAEIARCPKSVPADPNKILLICDQGSASPAMRFMDGYPQEMIGIVLISVTPVELTSRGLGLWSPRKECWAVPIWAVVGTRAKDAAKNLEMWRKMQSFVPAEASLTIDTRIGRGIGYILPDESISDWLISVSAGQKTSPGPDRQAQAERERFEVVASAIVDAAKRGSIAPAGPRVSKEEGPFTLSFEVPAGWLRDEAAERRYNPLGLAADKDGLPLGGKKQPYSEIYVTPKKQGPVFARVYAKDWQGSSAELLEDYYKRLARKGYLNVPLKRWQRGEWTYEISSILLPWQGRWVRWLTFAAARGGSPDKPAGTIVLVMDAGGKENGIKIAEALERICRSVATQNQHGKAGSY